MRMWWLINYFHVIVPKLYDNVRCMYFDALPKDEHTFVKLKIRFLL